MRPLVAIRRATAFDPRFLTHARDSHFWPLARPARAFDGCQDFPHVDALANVFEGDPPVRFVTAPPRRRRGAPVDVRALYDARITLDRAVPTRARCWHDLMNALVWGAFPLAKRALHARQYRAMARRLTPGTRSLPPARTPEQDALALLDEGGVILIDPREGPPSADTASNVIVFGHAIYESLALGVPPAVVAGISLTVTCTTDERSWVIRPDRQPYALRMVDRALASAIEDNAVLRSPHELRRLKIPTADAIS